MIARIMVIRASYMLALTFEMLVRKFFSMVAID